MTWKNVLETTGPYIDYYKPSSIYHGIYPEDFTFQKIAMLKEHDIKPDARCRPTDHRKHDAALAELNIPNPSPPRYCSCCLACPD